MLKKIVHKIARPYHPWRTIAFDELAELYTSMVMRSLGLSLIGIFVPVYLYKLGESISTILFFFVFFFLLRIVTSPLIARIVARIGPKHTIALSTVMLILFLALLLTYESLGWPLLLISSFYSVSNGLFFIASNTDFSKIKHQSHGGKELGWLYIFERAGGAIGPVLGGLIASWFAPEYTIGFAIVVLLGSLVPLFMTNEPVKLHQHIHFSGFPYRRHMRDAISMASMNVVNLSNGLFWPFLVAVFIFTDDTYAKLGILVGGSLAVSMFSAHMFGKVIDSRKGAALLKYGVVMNAVLGLSRYMVTAGGGAVAASLLGEPINLSYRMPLTKGFFDAADSEEGYRIVYITLMEMFVAFWKAILCLALFLAALHADGIQVLRLQYIIVAVAGFVMLLQRFPALKKVY